MLLENATFPTLSSHQVEVELETKWKDVCVPKTEAKTNTMYRMYTFGSNKCMNVVHRVDFMIVVGTLSVGIFNSY